MNIAQHIAYLGLGSNLGNGERNIQKAMEMISDRVGEILAVSSFYKSEPWGFESEHLFTNNVIKLRTSLSPTKVLDITQEIEKEMGRTKKHKPGESYTDRIIDIDILTYDDLELRTERLTLPHPFIQERDFVRIPLEEINGENKVLHNNKN